MVTKLSDGRGQTTLKGHAVTDEWENLIRVAAARNGSTVADFVVAVTTDAAQSVLKGKAAVPAGLPARPADVVDQLAGMVADALAPLQAVLDGAREDRARQQREARRGRWR